VCPQALDWEFGPMGNGQAIYSMDITTRKHRYSDGHSDGKWNPRNIPTEFRGNYSPSEYSEEIPRKTLFLGKNRWIPRKYYSRWRAVGGFYKIPRKFRRTSFVRRNSVGISSVCRQDLNYKYKHSSSSSFTSYLHPPSYSIYTRIWFIKKMPSSNYFRSWIDRPYLDPNTRLLTEEYQRGITEFMGK